MKVRNYAWMLSTVSVLACAPMALAQGTDAATTEAAADSNRRLDTVTVTAQFKEQGLQDTSLAIDALSGDDLNKDGINSAAALTDAIPALTITNGGGINGQVYMRGIGNSGSNNSIDGAIILNYDGVAVARGGATSIGAFYDVQRIEILKGPQGTLYGKNATGGVINIVPVRPKVGVQEGFIRGAYGNYSEYDLSAGFNAPVGESSAFRIAGSVVGHDGYNNDGTGDDDRKSVRAQFLTELSADLSLRFAADYTDIGGIGTGTTPIGSYSRAGLGTFNFNRNTLPLNEGSRTDAANDFRNTLLAAPGFGFLNDIQDEWYTDGQLWGVNAELKYDTGLGELTIIPAYREVEQDSRFGQPGFNSGWWQNGAQQRSLEARFASSVGDNFDYIAGAFWFDEDIQGNNTFNQEFVLPLQNYTLQNKSWAIFGEGTFHVNDSTRLILGARYTSDEKTMDSLGNTFIVFCGGLGASALTPPASFGQGCAVPGNLPHFPTVDTPEEAYNFLESNGWTSARIPIPPGFRLPLNNGVGAILHSIDDVNRSLTSEEPTYRISIEKDLFEDSLLFASFSRGYRSGGIETSGNIYEPEFIDAYTIGMNNTLAGGTLRLNLEAFWWDYTDQQITYFNLNDQGALQNTTDNVGVATNKGVEVDVIWLAAENTLIDATVQYLDASYDDLHFLTSTPRDNINCPFTVVGTTSSGSPALDFNCSGNQSIYSPEWTVQLGFEQTFPLSNGYEVVFAADTTYLSDQVTGFSNLPHERIDSHTRSNINLTLNSPEGDWYIGAYVRNLENENRVRSSQNPLLGGAYVSVGPDMTYGVRLGKTF